MLAEVSIIRDWDWVWCDNRQCCNVSVIFQVDTRLFIHVLVLHYGEWNRVWSPLCPIWLMNFGHKSIQIILVETGHRFPQRMPSSEAAMWLFQSGCGLILAAQALHLWGPGPNSKEVWCLEYFVLPGSFQSLSKPITEKVVHHLVSALSSLRLVSLPP